MAVQLGTARHHKQAFMSHDRPACPPLQLNKPFIFPTSPPAHPPPPALVVRCTGSPTLSAVVETVIGTPLRPPNIRRIPVQQFYFVCTMLQVVPMPPNPLPLGDGALLCNPAELSRYTGHTSTTCLYACHHSRMV